MRRDLTASVVAVVVLTLLFGIVYPLVTTGVSQVLFPNKADGSRVELGGELVGSRLIGQQYFKVVPIAKADREKGGKKIQRVPDERYFQTRPSVTGYDPEVTYFDNLGPNSKQLSNKFKGLVSAYLDLEGPFTPDLTTAEIPADAVTTSASGVDPQISKANARIQANRVAETRGLPLERVLELVDDNTDGRALGVLGEPGVNVLELNLALDKESGK
ncbi:MAG: potassium-transporting ATPase subunit C [Solirubrobacterales bacterium]